MPKKKPKTPNATHMDTGADGVQRSVLDLLNPVPAGASDELKNHYCMEHILSLAIYRAGVRTRRIADIEIRPHFGDITFLFDISHPDGSVIQGEENAEVFDRIKDAVHSIPTSEVGITKFINDSPLVGDSTFFRDKCLANKPSGSYVVKDMANATSNYLGETRLTHIVVMLVHIPENGVN